jgi:hypothetical protein
MAIYDHRVCLILSHRFRPTLSKRRAVDSGSLNSAEPIDIDLLLEELAEIIESEAGVLIA